MTIASDFAISLSSPGKSPIVSATEGLKGYVTARIAIPIAAITMGECAHVAQQALDKIKDEK